ncbi:MAG TPA: polysaccharide deacetylase family protein [Burkholderiales bacterium]
MGQVGGWFSSGGGAPRGLWDALKHSVPPGARRALRRAGRAASFVPRQCLGTITHVHTREPLVALTFDDGPHPESTPRFVEALEAHGARATFFVIGELARRYPELVARLRAGGHALGNHSWDHASFPAISRAERRAQLRAWVEAVGDARPQLFRPPYGNQTLLTHLEVRRQGWEVVTWSVVARDWTGDGAEAIASRVLRGLRPGAIVLMHERLHRYEDARYAARESVLAALIEVLATAGRSYRFVTVPELLRAGRPNREIWIQPGQADYLARLRADEEGDSDGRFSGT